VRRSPERPMVRVTKPREPMLRATKPRETGGACDEAQRDRWCVRRSPERPMVRATKPRETDGACDEAQRDRWFVRRSPEGPVVRATKPRGTGGSCDEAQRDPHCNVPCSTGIHGTQLLRNTWGEVTLQQSTVTIRSPFCGYYLA